MRPEISFTPKCASAIYLRDYLVAIYCNWNMKNFDETEKPNSQIKSHRYAILQSATLELLLVPKLLSIDNKNPDFQYSHDWWRKSILVSKWHSDTFYHFIGSQKLGSKLYKDILLITAIKKKICELTSFQWQISKE